MKTHRWLDLSNYGMKLIVVIHPTGSRILIVENGDKQPDAMRRLGFQRHESAKWFILDANAIVPRQYLRELPNATVREFLESDILSNKSDFNEIVAKIDSEKGTSKGKIKKIGYNSRCQVVFESDFGERFVAADNDKRFWENKTTGLSPDVFLRAVDESSRLACVEGFIETRVQIGDTETVDCESFASACGLEDLEQFHKDMGKSVRQRVLQNDSKSLHEKFKTCTTLQKALQGTPAIAEAKSLAIAIFGKKMLGNERDLVGQKIRISGFENDAKKMIRPKACINAKVNEESDIDLKLFKNTSDALNSIKNMNANNRSVLLIPVDSIPSAQEFLTESLPLTEVEACTLLTESDECLLTLSVFGNQPSSETPQLDVIADQNELWSRAVKLAEQRSDAIENARMGIDTDARFTSASASLSLNEFQKPYESLSKVDVPTTMIPRELDSVTKTALNRIAKNFGDIDKAMAQEFGYDEEEFKRTFAPEQVDAMALAIDADLRNRGFLIADGTGVGKGRPLAALMTRAISQGKNVIFISEKDANLSDIQRDIKHINRLDSVTPLVLNENVSLIDEETEKPFKIKSKNVLHNALDTGKWPKGVNVVYATYSQFNRKIKDSKRSKWLNCSVNEDTVLIVDEIHNAASGTSNTSENIFQAINRAGSVFYSSATHAATSRMVAFYERLFPEDIDSLEMVRMVAKGGEPLQEVLTSMLVADGVMIRRERDLSNIDFSQQIDTARMEQNKKYMDELAAVIAEMAAVSVDIAEIVRSYNGDLARLRDGFEMRMMPFGLSLHSLTRFASACLCAEFAADRAVSALENGEKPIVMVDSTIQAILEDCFENGTAGPDFKAVIHRVFSRLTKTHIGIFEEEDGEVREADTAEPVKQSIERVRELIDALPDLPAYPIDLVKQRIETAGYSCGEITGRMFEVKNDNVVVRTDRDRVSIKNGFNNGRFDSLIMNVSSSTGVDLHSSNRFKDKRRRVFIELQAPQSVQRQVQAFGRISRRDEAISPRIEFLSAGLPTEIRLAAMRNKRLRRMSANVTSNRDSAFLTKQIPDIINSVGDAVITKYAEIRPDLVKKLCLDPESLGKEEISTDIFEIDDETKKDFKHSANTFLARLNLLPTETQEKIISELFAEYEFHIAELEAQGENPLRPREIEGIVHLGKPVLFEGKISKENESVFNSPLYLHDARIERVVKAMDSESMLSAVEEGAKHMSEVSRAIEKLEQNQEMYLETYLTGGIRTVEQAIAQGDKKIVSVRNKMIDLCSAIPMFTPGRSIKITAPDDSLADAIITQVIAPKEGFEHMPHQYRVKLAIPGEVKLKTYFVSTLLKMTSVANRDDTGNLQLKTSPGLEGEDYDSVLNSFDNATSVLHRSAKFLMSNIYSATRIAAKHKAGSLVSFVDANGMRHKGVIVKKNFEKKLAHLPMRIDGADAIYNVLTSNVKKIRTAPGSERSGITITAANAEAWSLVLPRPRRRGERILWKSEAYQDLFNSGETDSKGASKVLIRGCNRLRSVLNILDDAGYQTFFIDPKSLSNEQKTTLTAKDAWRAAA